MLSLQLKAKAKSSENVWNSQCDKYSSYEWYKCEICDFSTARKDIIENHTDVFITGVLTAIHASKVRKVYRAI